MAPAEVHDAAAGLIALGAALLTVVITLVALLPALAEAALRATDTPYERASRGALIEGHLRRVRLQIPLFCAAIIIGAAAWQFKCVILVATSAFMILGGLIWLSYSAYKISQSLGRFLVENKPK